MTSRTTIASVILVVLLISGCGTAGECWVRTWGGPTCFPAGIVVDESGNIYLTGDMSNGDVDPGPGQHVVTGMGGGWDIFLTKLDPDGNLTWAQTFGGRHPDYGYDVLVDRSSNVYVTGQLIDPVGFDPGPGFEEPGPVAQYHSVVFLSKYNSEGQFEWARTWERSGYARRECNLALDQAGNIYCASAGPIRRFHPDGGFEVLTDIIGDAVATEASGGFYVTGDYWGREVRDATDHSPIYLKRYDSNDQLLWECEWGESARIDSYGLTVSSTGAVYVLGEFDGSVDLNPGSGMDMQGDDSSLFLSKFDLEGNFQWARTWANSRFTGRWDERCEFATDDFENVYIVGKFAGQLDLNPGVGTDVHGSSIGGRAPPPQVQSLLITFLVKLSSSGEYQWARTWGRFRSDFHAPTFGIALDASGDIYIASSFEGTVDFDAGPGRAVRSASDNGAYLIRLSPDGTLR